ncbi:MAG: hypothetical protein ACFFBH_01860 [Promethearchaeota archaeon]
MENLSNLLAELIKKLRSEILEYYDKSYMYIKDLYSYKKIDIKTKFSDIPEKDVDKGIYAIISATNSALNTIGIPIEQLSLEKNLFNNLFKNHRESYSNYDSFIESSLKAYINKYLFIIILEYVLGIDQKKIQNLDLFDLLPKKFLHKLNQFRGKEYFNFEEKTYIQQITSKIDLYYDVNNFTIDKEKLNSLVKEIKEVSSKDILRLLEKAKKDNIEVLGKSTILKQTPSKDFIPETKKKLSFLDYFGNFPQLDTKMLRKLNINIDNLLNCVENEIDFFDLENLFYLIIISKVMGTNLPFRPDEVLKMLKNFISGKVFSTGMYHKPNPISNFYGLSILSELNLLDKTEIIDIFEIEMILEKELKNFLPEKLSLNFYSLLSLKILERNGGTISNKDHLIKPLIDLDLLLLENKSLPTDMFYHLGLLKLIDNDINLNIFKNIYNSEIKTLISPKGLINNNLTDTSRALLIYDMLDFKNEEYTTVNTLFRNIIQYSNFFSNEQLEEDFNWKNNKLAMRVELRMLFWTLLASLQYLEFQS